MRYRIRLPRGAELIAHDPLCDQCNAKRQQQSVEGIEPIEMAQEEPLDEDPQDRHGERREDQREPVIHAKGLHPDVRGESAEHVEGAVRKIHNPEKPENHRQTEAEKRVEGSVDQPQSQLAENRGQGDTEHGETLAHAYFLAKLQAGSGCDPSASSPGMTLITL